MSLDEKAAGGAARPRVVVVDDDAELIDRMRQLLEDDYEVLATADWGTLNRIFFRGGCDLVLMDLNLPTLRGDRLVQILRSGKTPGLQRPAIVYFSAEDETTLARLSVETGADGYLSKSARAADMRRVIAEHLARRATRKG